MFFTRLWGNLVSTLVGFDGVVKLGNFAQRVRGKKPDPARARIGNAHQHDRDVGVGDGEDSDRLLIGNTIVGVAFRRGADAPQVADKGAVHQHLQLPG